MKAQARARHETINQCFKMWGVMSRGFRGNPELHKNYCNVVANLTQFPIVNNGYKPEENERKFFLIYYNAHGGTNVATNPIPMAGDASDEEYYLSLCYFFLLQCCPWWLPFKNDR
jgi:hypothetical protein